jgi:hypothetical protein
VALRASDLAAVAGLHPYRPQADEVLRLRARLAGGRAGERRVRAASELRGLSSAALRKAAARLGADGGGKAPITTGVAPPDEAEAKAKDDPRRRLEVAARVLRATDVVAVREARARAEAVRAERAAERAATPAAAQRERALAQAARDKAAGARRALDEALGSAGAAGKTVAAQRTRMAEGTVGEAGILAAVREAYGDLRAAEPVPFGAVPPLEIGRTPGGVRVVLVGVPDAVVHDDQRCDDQGNANVSHVIEIKRRKNRLFRRVVEYERIQVLAYLCLVGATAASASGVGGANLEATLVEEHAGGLERHAVLWDQALWTSVVEKAMRCVDQAVQADDAPSVGGRRSSARSE